MYIVGPVKRWREGNGTVSDSVVLSNHDLLIVQLDADVAHKTYESARIDDAPFDNLPCCQPCPPPSATTDALQMVILSWLEEETCPEQIILCTPSKSIEAWVLAALCPDNNVVQRGDWECYLDPSRQLSTLPKKSRFAKNISDYRVRKDKITTAWGSVVLCLSEAARFETDFKAAITITTSNTNGLAES